MSDDEKEPVIVTKKAIDVTPNHHGIYCTVGGGKPFVNVIAARRWAEDGKRIVFMLETFNFDFRMPDEDMEVVEMSPSPSFYTEERRAAEDAEFRKKAPMSDAEHQRTFAE